MSLGYTESGSAYCSDIVQALHVSQQHASLAKSIALSASLARSEFAALSASTSSALTDSLGDQPPLDYRSEYFWNEGAGIILVGSF